MIIYSHDLTFYYQALSSLLTRLWLHLWMSVSFSGLSSEFVDAMLKMFIGPLVPVFFWTPQVPSIIFTLEKKDKIKGIQPSSFLSYFWVGITILLVVIDLTTSVGLWFHWVDQKTNNCIFLKPVYWFLTEFYNTCLSKFMFSTDFS